MEGKRKQPPKNAAYRADKTATKNELYKSYIKPILLSSLKILLGEALLFGDSHDIKFWELFEWKLRRYVDLSMSRGRDEQRA
jgi:hypothetical protein